MECAVLRIARRRPINMNMAAWIWEWRIVIELIREHRAAIIRLVPGLVTVCSSDYFEPRNGPAIRPQRQFNVQVQPVAEQYRLAATRGGRHNVANDQHIVA